MRFLRRWFGNTIDFTNISNKKLQKVVSRIDLSEQEKHDYTIEYRGHAIISLETVNESPVVTELIGFNDAGRIIGGKKALAKGDLILMNTTNGKKVGKFLVLEIEYKKDPSDMFTCYIVGMGYEQTKRVDHGVIYN